MKKILSILAVLIALPLAVHATPKGAYRLSSPAGNLTLNVEVAGGISISLMSYEQPIVSNSQLGFCIRGKGDMTHSPVASTQTAHRREHIVAPFYRQAQFDTEYNALTIKLKSGLTIEFRAYDEGIAYRYVMSGMKNKDYIVEDEAVLLNVVDAGTSWLPYSTNPKKPEAMAFQAVYSEKPLDQQPTDNLAFLPCVVESGIQNPEAGEGTKLTLMESDVEAYPALFVRPDGNALRGCFAHFPKKFAVYPWRVQRYVSETEDYIARCRGNRNFPWRIVGVTNRDDEMPVNDLVYALASPNRIGNTDWIRPGLVSWDWWNDWGLSHVPFRAGINTTTYKYYIDFASTFHLPYIILDEGWYNPKSGDMLTTINDIDLPEIIEYGRQKGVRVILWTVFNVLDDQLDAACEKYSQMGVAGFKVDFLDRNDQEAVEMAYRIAERCARHKLILDYHGIFPPTGMLRTFPNVINFESVFGMEEAKWTKHDEQDMPRYDVTFPFIRQQAGYTDFTPGGMRNATRADFQPVYSNPMTMGTRCHQLAMYIVHDSPLTMLADNPTEYQREPQYTEMIATLPTVFDETRVLDGVMGRYIVMARRSGNDWYIAGQTNWDARDVEVLFTMLDDGATYTLTECVDGTNADKVATDYQLLRASNVNNTHGKTIHMASGGGFLLKLIRN